MERTRGGRERISRVRIIFSFTACLRNLIFEWSFYLYISIHQPELFPLGLQFLSSSLRGQLKGMPFRKHISYRLPKLQREFLSCTLNPPAGFNKIIVMVVSESVMALGKENIKIFLLLQSPYMPKASKFNPKQTKLLTLITRVGRSFFTPATNYVQRVEIIRSHDAHFKVSPEIISPHIHIQLNNSKLSCFSIS